VDYYFTRINGSTDAMDNLFQAAYGRAGGFYKRNDIGNKAELFVNTVVNSLSASMSRNRGGRIRAPTAGTRSTSSTLFI
jgi:hypothetical protein